MEVLDIVLQVKDLKYIELVVVRIMRDKKQSNVQWGYFLLSLI